MTNKFNIGDRIVWIGGKLEVRYVINIYTIIEILIEGKLGDIMYTAQGDVTKVIVAEKEIIKVNENIERLFNYQESLFDEYRNLLENERQQCGYYEQKTND